MAIIQRSTLMYTVGAASVIALAFLLGANAGTNTNPEVSVDKSTLPRTRVIEFEGEIGRFDTADGSIHRFSGNLNPTSASGTWVQSVRPLTSNTSGFLQIQEVPGATFLVDIVDGNTWVLRRNGSTGSWQKVKVLGN